MLFSVGSQVSGPTQKIAGHKKCRGQVSRPGPRAGVMTRQGPPSPAQARPGRDVNDQIMSTACTGPWEAREGGGQFQIIEPSFGWPREQGTKPIFYHNPAIQFSTTSCGGHLHISHVYPKSLVGSIIRVDWTFI